MIHVNGIHCSYHIHYHLEAAASITVEQPFETSVTTPAMWQYLAGLRQGSPERCTSSESTSNI